MRSAAYIDNQGTDYALICLAIFIIFIGGFGLYDSFAFPVAAPPKGTSIMEAKTSDESILGFEVKPGQDQVNIIILGCDERKIPKTNMWEGRADSIMVAMVNKRTKRAAVISVPRDLDVQIPPPHAAKTKINAAYSYYMHEGRGEEVTAQIVERILGIKIDYFIKTTIDLFPRAIDILGGVDLNVDKDMNYDDNWGHLHVHLRKGEQHLDGQQAAGFARHRHDNDNRNMSSDYERSRRQQYLIRELIKQKARPSSVLKLPALASEIRSCINTNLSFGELVALGILSRQIDTDKVRTGVVPVTDGLINGVWLSEVRQDQLTRMMRELEASLLGETRPPTSIAILNGSGSKGLAAIIAGKLRAARFTVGRTGNSPKQNQTETVIHYPPGAEEEAAAVQRFLHVGALVPDMRDEAAEPGVAITVVLGQDLLSTEAGQGALAPTTTAPAQPRLTPAPGKARKSAPTTSAKRGKQKAQTDDN